MLKTTTIITQALKSPTAQAIGGVWIQRVPGKVRRSCPFGFDGPAVIEIIPKILMAKVNRHYRLASHMQQPHLHWQIHRAAPQLQLLSLRSKKNTAVIDAQDYDNHYSSLKISNCARNRWSLDP